MEKVYMVIRESGSDVDYGVDSWSDLVGLFSTKEEAENVMAEAKKDYDLNNYKDDYSELYRVEEVEFGKIYLQDSILLGGASYFE